MSHLNHHISRFLIIFSLFSSFNAFSQGDTIIYDNEVYVDYVDGISFHKSGLPLSAPIIGLKSGSLNLSFDDMGGSIYDYTYQIIHCDKDWQPSELSPLEFLDGFESESIEDYAPSENTFIDYTHYSLRIPNQDIRLKITGNYLIVVNDEENLPILSRRFIVTDPKVGVKCMPQKGIGVETLKTHQSIYVELIDEDNYVTNPYDEIFITIMQNGRWDNSLSNIQPDNVIGDNIYFNTQRPFTFPGLKEYRSFDIRNLEFASREVHSIDISYEGAQAILELTKNRYYGNYTQENDANGAFLMRNDNDLRYDRFAANNYKGAVSGRYLDVYFTLKTKEIYDADVYVVGAFCDWKIREANKLVYEDERKVYLGNNFFKQGYYNYTFAVVDEYGNIDTEILEGNHFSTENDYTVIVYKRAFGNNYDEIIGVAQVNWELGQ